MVIRVSDKKKNYSKVTKLLVKPYLICMDENNMRNLNRMFNNDPDHKIYKLLSRDVSDPWYSNDFETAYSDIYEGCKAWLERLS